MYDPKFKDKLLQLKFIKFRGPFRENSFKGHSLATNDGKMDCNFSSNKNKGKCRTKLRG